MYDNLGDQRLPVAPSFIFEVEGVRLLYTYIRKNACSSFKHLFRHVYGYTEENSSVYSMMFSSIRVNRRDLLAASVLYDYSVFVYRDPMERVFSVFKNKLIQQSGAHDITKSIEILLGVDVALLTFRDFVVKYVSLLGSDDWREVDGHLYPQAWHLMPIKYSHPVSIRSLYPKMQSLLGGQIADRIFKVPVNSSIGKADFMPNSPYGPETPVSWFREVYKQTKALPNVDCMLDDNIVCQIKEIYKDDYDMLSKIDEG